MTGLLRPRSIGANRQRVDGPAKVTGTAPYAYEHPVPNPAYLHPVQATIARGDITDMRTDEAVGLDGVLAVLTPFDAPRLETGQDAELEILQSPEVHFRGQLIGAVVAETPEIARQAAGLVRVSYARRDHDVSLSADRSDLYRPDEVNAGGETDTRQGDPDGAFAGAARAVDATYTTPMYHNNPMEPHTTVASWDSTGLTIYDSTQGVHTMRQVVASTFGIEESDIRVVAPYVGGGFGSKGTPHANIVLTVLAAKRMAGRPVKYALTRQQMFSFVGYRTPTIQRVRLGADEHGRLVSLSNHVVEQTSRIKEYAEQSCEPARKMYAAPNRGTSHRLAPLDVPVPSWMRAPGECPGMFAPEVAMDELAQACDLDPIELRVRNEPETDPASGLPFSSRNLVACLREGARRFGWAGRPALARSTLEGGWWVGTGVASSAYPVHQSPGSSTATVRFTADRRYEVRIGAVDIGTGAWTALTQIAADALDVPFEDVDLRIGDTGLPAAAVAGGSSGITNWGWAIVEAARAFREKFGAGPSPGDERTATQPENPHTERFAMSAYGAQFAEVRVDTDTGEVRVPRLLGVFAAGRIVNPRTARSQFVGGMTMGLSMALHEESVTDERFGFVVNHDLAEYHIAACADVRSVEAHWLDEHDPYVNPMGTKGIGEIGIVGTAAAIANAAYHATGVRVRDLPITADKFL
ncbi:xanthine dehydrogenase family protein molybdopterin-binding subunit [Prauserella endophytica]|uniref:Xanthine dehydrogenase family protein molybdopterin-binding subunit n=1 Tax=Prauserella endophytica TaxID=1592324 RepID=A0ABY2RZK8_9PSEU|nr:xanthine dehydrogenase family protein molybdopterin-binding subunit [Prauserella endophytica]TKG66675.1 xanthine dehydrogenase family protein molybdopterin-binding subunit [Prauserella endophytica]